MSQDSQHGRWTVSSSDDDDEPLPPSGTKTSGSHRPAESNHSPASLVAVAVPVEVKPEPAKPPVTSLIIGSEARQSAALNQSNPVKYETSPSLAGKRKKEVPDSAGWALSDSDEDDGDVKKTSVSNLPKKTPHSPNTKKSKVEKERPPSPHGRLYYIDEPDDFFESCIPRLNDTYRFYLNKVTGLDKKYNSGALHIRGALVTIKINNLRKQTSRESLDEKNLIIMMLLWYEEGFRVIILTSNLIRADWYQKTQGMWMSPLFPRLPKGSSATAGESSTFFKRDLLEYLASYRAPELEEWIQRIKEHDLSEAKVYLVGSTPGRYVGSDMERWGHLRLRKVKTAFFSSIFKPNIEDVRMSLEGYPAGGSLPYSIQTAQKQLWLHSFFHRWKANSTGRSHAMPHIKTYMRASPDFTQLAWFLVTSANLSKAAWGALEKNNTQIMIRSYELGVLYVPSAFNMKTFPVDKNPFPVSSSSSGFPVPFDLPPTCYSSKDQPWIWNIPYSQAPDTHGNIWVPS
uniref:Tyrosyl-DNA phosphodiesterase 1 n=1 Tax=Acanthochromis polyacanthus TaxID=80966 RepID=A0A3Q1ED72_9TELE